MRACLVALFLALASFAAASAQPLPDRELVVGTKEAPPFAMKNDNGEWHGIAIDLWRRVAERLHLRYRLQEAPLDELVARTGAGDFDAAVAAITVTGPREKVVDFTQPFFTTGLGIAVPAAGESRWWPIVRSLLSFGFLQAVLALVAIAMGVGVVIWLFERRHNEHFSGGARGLASSFWWSAVAMTQAGAGDKAPVTLPGRLLAIAWMIGSIIALAVFTAGITSSLTTRELHGAVHGAADLRSVRVGAVAGSATIETLDRERIGHRGYPTAEDGLRDLAAGRIDAFVYDRPLLTWLVRQRFADTVMMLDVTFDPQTYAIALPDGSALRIPLDVALLEELRGDWWRQLLFQYLGSD